MTQAPRRVGVYNRYWPSRGGGERYSGMVAQVLAAQGAEVDLIGHEEIDSVALAEHLGLDLSRCRMRIVEDLGESALSELSSEYDLFVNGSYMSTAASKARRSLYLCYFPTPPDHEMAPWRRAARRTIGRHLPDVPEASRLQWGTGWFPAEGGGRRRWIWSNGEATLHLAPGPAVLIRFGLGRPGLSPTRLTVSVGDSVLGVYPVTPKFRPLAIAVPASDVTRDVHFSSAAVVPGAGDTRRLGIALSRLRITGAGLTMPMKVALRLPWLTSGPRDSAFIDSYDVVLGVSQFTVDWIQRYWDRASEVLYPPIQVQKLHPHASRAKTIISVGRFFEPGGGHSKRQLEQVHAFKQMVNSGAAQGWTLQLIGGCEPRSIGYLNTVRAAAEGLPVEVHANAPRAFLEDALCSASVQWSATGFGVPDHRRPWASEHFGMTTVEAMAGGCVPIVIDKAGQREIVRDGTDGYRWSTMPELIERTTRVARDDDLRTRLAASAIARAQEFSDATFAENLNAIVERHDLMR